MFPAFLPLNLFRDAPKFPVAFRVVANRDISRLARLLRITYRPKNRYCILVDSTPQFHSTKKNVISCFGTDVFIVRTEQSTEIQWDYANLFEPQLVCSKKRLTANAKWKYLVKFNAQAFPLRTYQVMVASFSALNGSNLIEATRKQQQWSLIGNYTPLKAMPG